MAERNRSAGPASSKTPWKTKALALVAAVCTVLSVPTAWGGSSEQVQAEPHRDLPKMLAAKGEPRTPLHRPPDDADCPGGWCTEDNNVESALVLLIGLIVLIVGFCIWLGRYIGR